MSSVLRFLSRRKSCGPAGGPRSLSLLFVLQPAAPPPPPRCATRPSSSSRHYYYSHAAASLDARCTRFFGFAATTTPAARAPVRARVCGGGPPSARDSLVFSDYRNNSSLISFFVGRCCHVVAPAVCGQITKCFFCDSCSSCCAAAPPPSQRTACVFVIRSWSFIQQRYVSLCQ